MNIFIDICGFFFQNYLFLEDFSCGNIIGCFVKCSGGQCDFIVFWNDIGEYVQFEMKKKFFVLDFSDYWIVIGFFEDKRMVIRSNR